MGPHACRWTVTLALVCGLAGTALAQSVALQGMLGSRALLMVDGGAPRGVAVGDTFQGVKVVSTSGDSAVVEVGGKRLTLRLGESPASVGGRGTASNGRIVLPADGGGHFMGQGSINGQAVQFMVDTGATLVALGQADAARLGIDLSQARGAVTQTANGPVPTQMVTLTRVRVGEVEVANVGAAVLPLPMPYVLLGNSFLSRFQMRRDNDVMRLELR